MTELIDQKEASKEEIVGEQLSKEYRSKTNFKDSAELRMLVYIIPVATIVALIAYFISR